MSSFGKSQAQDCTCGVKSDDHASWCPASGSIGAAYAKMREDDARKASGPEPASDAPDSARASVQPFHRRIDALADRLTRVEGELLRHGEEIRQLRNALLVHIGRLDARLALLEDAAPKKQGEGASFAWPKQQDPRSWTPSEAREMADAFAKQNDGLCIVCLEYHNRHLSGCWRAHDLTHDANP